VGVGNNGGSGGGGGGLCGEYVWRGVGRGSGGVFWEGGGGGGGGVG